MGVIQNRNNQTGCRQNYHKFLICTHKASPPFRKARNGERAAACSAARVSILYCQGGAWWDEVSRNEPAVLTVIGDFAKMFDPLLNNFITVGLNHSHDTP